MIQKIGHRLERGESFSVDLKMMGFVMVAISSIQYPCPVCCVCFALCVCLCVSSNVNFMNDLMECDVIHEFI